MPSRLGITCYKAERIRKVPAVFKHVQGLVLENTSRYFLIHYLQFIVFRVVGLITSINSANVKETKLTVTFIHKIN